jgi:hypothetical protein
MVRTYNPISLATCGNGLREEDSMYININGAKISITGAYEDQGFIDGFPRPAVHITSHFPIDKVGSLVGNKITVFSDNDEAIREFEPCESVASCEIILTRNSESEKEIAALRSELENVKAEKAVMATELAALKTVKV